MSTQLVDDKEVLAALSKLKNRFDKYIVKTAIQRGAAPLVKMVKAGTPKSANSTGALRASIKGRGYQTKAGWSLMIYVSKLKMPKSVVGLLRSVVKKSQQKFFARPASYAKAVEFSGKWQNFMRSKRSAIQRDIIERIRSEYNKRIKQVLK